MSEGRETFTPGRGRKGPPAPVEIAERLLAETMIPTPEGDQHAFLQDAAGITYQYNGKWWEEIGDETLHALVLRLDDKRAWKSATRREVIEYVKATVHRRDHAFGRVAHHEIAFDNGVVDVRTGRRRPHRPQDYLDSVLPWSHDPGAACPTWLRVLADWFPEAPDADGRPDTRPAALQDFFGYVALPHARYKRALFCLGPSNCGKSLVALLLKAMVGDRFTCTLPVSDMDDPVKRWVIKHKRLNIMTELPTDAIIADGGFKTMVSSEEPIFINGKYEKPVTYVPVAKHVIAANNLPTVNDRTLAVVNRLLIIEFHRVFSDQEMDVDLLNQLIAEMPGILNWVMGGARRLDANGGLFTEPTNAAERVREMREAANPLMTFVRERMVPELGAAAPLGEVARAFNEWNQGQKWEIRRVGKALRSAGYTVKDHWFKEGGSVVSLIDHRFPILDPPTIP